MADNSVFITGIADGALEEALSDLPPWATEDTAHKIEMILKQSLNIQTKALSALIKKATTAGGASPADLDDEFKKFTKDLHDERPKRKKSYKEEDEEFTKKKKRWATEKSTFDGKAVIEANLIKLGLGIKGTFIDNIDTFDQLYRAGVNVVDGFDNVSSGFDSLQQLASITGVRFTELAGTIVKYNAAINAFGLGKFAKTIGAASASLREFGYTNKEASDLLGVYLDSQQGYTDISRRSQAQTTQDLIAFGQRITKASQATGMMRDKILENYDALSHTVDATLLSGQATASATENTLEFISSIKNQKLGQELISMMTDTIKPLNTTFQHLQKVGGGAFATAEMNLMQNMKNSNMSAEEQQKSLATFVGANEGNIKQMMQQNKLLEQAGNADAAAANEHLNSLLQQSRLYKQMSNEDRKKMNATAKATADIKSSFERFSAALQILFSPLTKVLDAITFVLDIVNSVISTIPDVVGTTILSIAGLGIAVIAVTKGMKGFTDVLKALFGMGKSQIGKWGGGASGAGGAGSRAGGAAGGMLGGIGKGLAGLGKGLGTGLGGILTGIAKGISAFGTPKVLFGIVNIGLAAAAVWGIGKALKEFTGEDFFTSLGNAAAGLLVLGAGAVAFGLLAEVILPGALAMAALAAGVGLLGIAINQVGTGFTTFGVGIQTISTALDKFTGLSKLKDIVATINDLSLVKAAAFAALSLVSLPKLSAPSSASPLTTPKASELSSPSEVSTKGKSDQSSTLPGVSPAIPGKEKAIGGADINTVLEHHSSILEQILQSTKDTVSVNKDILKYTRIQS